MSKIDRTVTVTLGFGSQIYDTDWEGHIIKDAEDALAMLQCTIDFEEESRVAFGIIASFPNARIKAPDDKHISDRLSFLTWKIMSTYLEECTEIDLFHIHRIPLVAYLGKRLPKTPERSSEYLSPFKCKITTETFETLRNQYTEYFTARKSFVYAVDKLRDFADLTPHGLKYHQSEIYSLLEFIEQSLESADVGHLYGWYKEKQSCIRSYFADMLRRKQANHPGYKSAQDYISRNLFSYRAPDVWRDHPPILQTIKDED